MKASIGSRDQVRESSIDERYQLLLLSRYLQNVKEVPVASGGSKWIFSCPFCSSLGRTESKRNERKGALLWNATQNSWIFYCVRQGSAECSGRGKTLEGFLGALDADLAENYRMIDGTQGKLERDITAPLLKY
jgi:hypothetical protein